MLCHIVQSSDDKNVISSTVGYRLRFYISNCKVLEEAKQNEREWCLESILACGVVEVNRLVCAQHAMNLVQEHNLANKARQIH